MDQATSKHDFVALAVQVVSAYVTHNPVAASDLPKLLSETHSALVNIEQVKTSEPEVELKPAVPVKKSLHNDYLICLEDGKKFKSLKRHLRTHYNMSPEEYREKWNLPKDYPMVAPSYSQTRSKLAKDNGLGRKAA